MTDHTLWLLGIFAPPILATILGTLGYHIAAARQVPADEVHDGWLT